jgi:glycerol-3-phosphate acyltransferase PlsY
MFKGTVAVLVAKHFGIDAALAAGLGAFVGHLFPVWLKFKGGKGVATYIGVLIGLYWPAALAFCVIWLSIAAASRYSSLAALIASALTPLGLWAFGRPNVAVLFLFLTAALWFMHRENIARLLNGTEGKIGVKAAATPTKLKVVFCHGCSPTVREGGNILGEPVHLSDEERLDWPLLVSVFSSDIFGKSAT